MMNPIQFAGQVSFSNTKTFGPDVSQGVESMRQAWGRRAGKAYQNMVDYVTRHPADVWVKVDHVFYEGSAGDELMKQDLVTIRPKNPKLQPIRFDRTIFTYHKGASLWDNYRLWIDGLSAKAFCQAIKEAVDAYGRGDVPKLDVRFGPKIVDQEDLLWDQRLESTLGVADPNAPVLNFQPGSGTKH